MTQITKEQAREFLQNIDDKEKVALVFHEDPDGFASALCFYDFLKDKIKKFSLTQVDLAYGIQNLEELKQNDTIIISDLSPNILSKELEELKDKKIFYTDHHQKDSDVPKNILELRTPSEKPSSLVAHEITQKKDFLALLGLISDAGFLHKENQNFINEKLKKYNLNLQKAKELADDLGFFLRTLKDTQKAFEILEKINSPKDLEKIEEIIKPLKDELKECLTNFEKNKEKIGEINFFYFKPKLCGKGALINKLSYENPDDILIFATPKNENLISISARNQNKKMNMVDLLNFATHDLENTTSGGHIPAAGAKIQAKDLQKFKENLKKFQEQNNSPQQ